MSDNLTVLIEEVINIQEIVKYLTYAKTNPLSQPDVALPAKSLVRSRVHPYPFDPLAKLEDVSELRIYYPEGEFDGSGAVANTFLYFDIVVAKSLWLVNDGKAAIRPYMIMKHLVEHFRGRSIKTLGRVDVTNFVHLHVNEKFDAIRLEANVTLFGDKRD